MVTRQRSSQSGGEGLFDRDLLFLKSLDGLILVIIAYYCYYFLVPWAFGGFGGTGACCLRNRDTDGSSEFDKTQMRSDGLISALCQGVDIS